MLWPSWRRKSDSDGATRVHSHPVRHARAKTHALRTRPHACIVPTDICAAADVTILKTELDKVRSGSLVATWKPPCGRTTRNCSGSYADSSGIVIRKNVVP